MTAKTKKNNKSITPMSVQEFKMWIKGLSEFQDDNWSPNKSQWEHIRSLIDGLNDTVVVSARSPQPAMKQPMAPMGETAVLTDAVQHQTMTQPVQTRFLDGNGRKSAGTGELDEFGKPILKSAYATGSDFA